MSANHQIKLVVFDLDGTAVDFGCQAPVGAMLEAFSRQRIMLTMQQVRSSLGLPNYEHVRSLLEMPAVGEQFQIVHGRRWNEADALHFADDLVELQTEFVSRYCGLVPALAACVEELKRRGIKLGTTTSYPRQTAEQIWDLLGIEGLAFDAHVAADDTPSGRPAPWMIYRLMQELDVFPPWRVLKVGDTAADIEEGRNAGCWSVGVIASGNEIGLTLNEWLSLSPAEQDERQQNVVRKLLHTCASDWLPTLADLPATIDSFQRRLALGERP
ncbi:MAG: phosphonoacetaldehyde hydrolase [Planctomycetaceae bacterium]|nr:phosphonoacetaldehyde hydrolase [Planctomycetaceae bacterium]